MQKYFAAATFVLLVVAVVIRAQLMRRKGIRAVLFGQIDRLDFLLPPFALFYFYLIIANAFSLPTVGKELFSIGVIAWIGVLLCLLGIALFAVALVSFKDSFRVGIDTDHADKLITTGIFAFSRNPIYVAFSLVLLGQFLVYSNWIMLIYLAAGASLLPRQVLREEDFLRGHYGKEYQEYCKRVRRYL